MNFIKDVCLVFNSLSQFSELNSMVCVAFLLFYFGSICASAKSWTRRLVFAGFPLFIFLIVFVVKSRQMADKSEIHADSFKVILFGFISFVCFWALLYLDEYRVVRREEKGIENDNRTSN